MPVPSTSRSSRACASPLAIRVFVQRGDEPPELLLFEQAAITIGRPAKSGQRPAIALADCAVSRRHAALHVTARSLRIEDRGGRAGIFLGGEQVRGRADVEPGQRITLAAYTIWIERCVTPQAPQPPRSSVPSSPPSPAPWEPDVGAASWVRAGEPARLLVRGRARARARAWLREHADVDPEDPRRRWIEASLGRGASRLRRLCAVGVGAAATLALSVAFAGPPPSPPLAHDGPLRCPRAELAAIESWIDASPSASRAAAALRWAESAACPGGVRLELEGRLHRALADDGRAPVGTVAGSVTEMSAVAGEEALVLVDSTGARRLATSGEQVRFGGASSRWSLSADGRWAAELGGAGRVVLWSIERAAVEVARFDAGGGIVAAAFDPRGETLRVVAGGRLRGWARAGDGWTALEEREDMIGISAEDRVEVGAGGLIVGQGAELWWQPLDGRRVAPRHLGRVDAWLVAEDGAALLTSDGREIRRWHPRGRGLRGAAVVGLEGRLRAWAAIPGGSTIAVASGAELRLLDTRQRWRRGEPLARALDLEGRAVDELTVDPSGRWLLAGDDSGALRWRIDGVNAVVAGAPLRWRGRPDHGVVVGDDLVVSRGARVERRPLLGEAGSDGAVVDHGGPVTAVALGGEGELLATAGSGVVRLWRRDGSAGWRRAAAIESPGSSPALAFLRGRGGPLLAVARGRHVEVYALAEDGLAVVATFSHGRPVVELRAVDGSQALVGLDAQGGAALWSVDPEGAAPRRRTWALDSAATAFAEDPSGPRLLLGDAAGGLHRIDLERPQGAEDIGALRALPGHQQALHAIAVSDDGQRVATSGEDGRVRVLDPDDASTLRTFEASGVRSLAFLGGGAWLAVRGEDGVIRAHSTTSAEVVELGRRPGPPAGIVALAEGRLAVRSDRGVEIWAVERRGARPRVVAAMALARDGDGPLAVWAIDPRSETLVTAETEGLVRVRPLAADAAIALACSLEFDGAEARSSEDSSSGLLAGVSLVDPCGSPTRSEPHEVPGERA